MSVLDASPLVRSARAAIERQQRTIHNAQAVLAQLDSTPKSGDRIWKDSGIVRSACYRHLAAFRDAGLATYINHDGRTGWIATWTDDDEGATRG